MVDNTTTQVMSCIDHYDHFTSVSRIQYYIESQCLRIELIAENCEAINGAFFNC